MRKHIYLAMAGILFFGMGTFLFLSHVSNTFAWSSNNNYLDNDFWDNDWDGSTGMLVDALYGNGNIGTDKSFYTQDWQFNNCDTSTMNLVIVSPGTDNLPSLLSGNTIYLLMQGTHILTHAVTINQDCTAIVGQREPRSQPSEGAWVETTATLSTGINIVGVHNSIMANMIFADMGSVNVGIYLKDTDNSTINIRDLRYFNDANLLTDNADYNVIGAISYGSAIGYNLINGSDHNILGGQALQDTSAGRKIENSDYNTFKGSLAWYNYVNCKGYYITNANHTVFTNGGGYPAQANQNDGRGVYIENSSDILFNQFNIAGNVGGSTKPAITFIGSSSGYMTNGSITANISTGLFVQNSSGIKLYNVYAWTNSGAGINIANSSDINLGAVITSGNKLEGISAVGSTGIILRNSRSRNNLGDGFLAIDSQNISVFTTYLTTNGGNGLHVSGGATDHNYTGNYVTGNTANGIYRQAANSLLGYNKIDDNDISSNGNAGIKMEGYGSQLTNNTVSNNAIHNNVSDGVYMQRGYFTTFDTNDVYSNGGRGLYLYQTVGNSIINQNVYQNTTAGIRVEGLMNNSVSDSLLYSNGEAGLQVSNADETSLSGVTAYSNTTDGIDIQSGSDATSGAHIVTYDNGQHGLHIHTNSLYQGMDDVTTFRNTVDGIHIDSSSQASITNIQSYNNLHNGITYASSEGSTIHNALVYNNVEAGLELLEGARYGAFNNMDIYANSTAIKTIGGSLGIQDNAFNNIAMFSNTIGWYIGPTSSPDNGNVRNNTYNYNNDEGIRIEGPITSSDDVYYGDFYLYRNNYEAVSDTSNQIISALSQSTEPSVGRGVGVLKSGMTAPTVTTSGAWTLMKLNYTPNYPITCNDSIQTAWSGQNMFVYPFCRSRGYSGSWNADLGVEYTFFPHMPLQKEPVWYDNGSLSVTGLEYHTMMYAGDYSDLGDTAVGGNIKLDTGMVTNFVSYISGGIDYTNQPSLPVQYNNMTSDPIIMFTGVNNPSFDGISYLSPIAGIGYTYNDFIPLIDTPGIKILRASSYDAANDTYSRYYGIMEGLAYDAISIQKTAASGLVQEGTQMSFTITVTNAGALAGESQVFDLLPRVISPVGLETTPTGTYSGDIHAIIWDMPQVVGDTTYTFTITGQVNTGFIGQNFLNTGFFISDFTHSGNDLVLYSEAPFAVMGCGDGILGAGEQCDQGVNNNNGPCSDTCTLMPPSCALPTPRTNESMPLSAIFSPILVVGSDILYYDYGDGNTGTSSTHVYTQSGTYTPILYVKNSLSGSLIDSCTGEILTVTPPSICGNNIPELGEQCDDGNTNSNDGCDSGCTWEMPSCTIQADTTGGLIPVVANFTRQISSGASIQYIAYGDGTTGTLAQHTYTWSLAFSPLMYVMNTLNPVITNTCAASSIVTHQSTCGDGFAEGTEQCDDGNGDNTDSCTNTCENPICGDVYIQPGADEQCDDGANNGVACDPAYAQSCNYCASDCTIASAQGGSCGDNLVQTGAGEECDEGANNGVNGCSGDCQFKTPTCTVSATPMTGYAPLDVTFSGTFGNFASFDYINYNDGTTGTGLIHTYTVATGVGNYQPRMYVYNTTYPSKIGFCSISGKQALHVTAIRCGDSIVSPGETCDSGETNGISCNASYGGTCNYCTQSCQTNSIQGGYCGDGITESTEQCDDGNSNDSDLCSNTCVATCGDGNIDGSEQCDLGPDNGLGACTTSCTLAPPVCTIAITDYSQGILPVYIPFNILCLDYTKLTYIDYGDGTTGKNFSGHIYNSIGGYTPTIYFQNILGGPVDDNDDTLQVSTLPQYCGDGIKNGNEECDGGSNCTASCTKKTSHTTNTPPPPIKDNCPNGDFSASYYDKTCGEATQHAAAEILDKYSIIHGDYNKGPEDPARYSLDRILKRNELRKIMVRTITDQKYQAPFAGETWADNYKMILENKLNIVYGKIRAHEDQVTYIEAINSILESLYYLGRIKSPVIIRTMAGGGRPITRGQMMALVVRFVLPEALQSVQEDMAKLRK